MPTILNRFFLLYNHLLLPNFIPKFLKSLSFSSSSDLPPITPQSPPLPPASALVPHRRIMDPAELKRVFQMFDRNGDGRITTKELSDSLENLGIFIPDEELRKMIEKIDVNGDGCVDIEEFGELYQSLMMGDREEAEEDVDG